MPRVRHAIRSLFAPGGYRRWGFLLLGGALLAPYAMIMVLLPTVMEGPVFGMSVPAFAAGLAAVLVAATGPIPAVGRLEAALAWSLLGGPPGPPPDRLPQSPEWRHAVWFWLHLAAGGVVTALTILVPLLLAAGLLAPFHDGVIQLEGWRSPAGWTGAWIPFAALAFAAAMPRLAHGLAAALTRLAPVLLGPPREQRIQELERLARRLAERNQVARELHDSVGHALTITTLQAGVAKHLFHTDPAFAYRALTAIEEAGRTAAAELDHVVGLLRDDARKPAVQPTLADLDALLDASRDLGVEVRATVTGPVERVPGRVSREMYRIVQEGLTNAMDHAGCVPVTMHLTVTEDWLELELTNPLGRRGRHQSGRHGLTGMRERAILLRGGLSAEAVGGHWHLSARLPLPATP